MDREVALLKTPFFSLSKLCNRECDFQNAQKAFGKQILTHYPSKIRCEHEKYASFPGDQEEKIKIEEKTEKKAYLLSENGFYLAERGFFVGFFGTSADLKVTVNQKLSRSVNFVKNGNFREIPI